MRRASTKTYVSRSGYRKFKGSNKPVHRWVAEKKIGRELKPMEVVHHKDRNKLNNSPSNLRVLCSQSEHYNLHKKAGY